MFLKKNKSQSPVLLTSASNEKSLCQRMLRPHIWVFLVSDSSTLSLLQTGADVQFDRFSIYDPTGTKKCIVLRLMRECFRPNEAKRYKCTSNNDSE